MSFERVRLAPHPGSQGQGTATPSASLSGSNCCVPGYGRWTKKRQGLELFAM